NCTYHQVIQTSDNSIVKPELDHHEGRPGLQARAGELKSEPLGPLHNEPFPFLESYAPFERGPWQTDTASSANGNTEISTLGISNSESTPWSRPEDWLSPYSASLFLMDGPVAAGSGNGGASYEVPNYFD
ncbi:hypothetical protein E4U55_001782, partial [Claviceps digitariae]